MQLRTFIFLIISIVPFTCFSQKKQAKAIRKVEPIEVEDENHPPMGSPIANLLKAIDYAEISYDCFLTPNCATELDEDGTVPTDKTTFDAIEYIIKRDAIGYYELDEEVNSPLKMKKYKESQDYKDYLSSLNKVRSCVMNHEYFIESKFDSKFDLDNQTFCFDVNPYCYEASPNDYEAGVYCYQLKLLSTDSHLSNSSLFTTPVLNEDLAYEIEKNKVKVFLFVKIADQCDGSIIQLIPQKLYLATLKTGKILYEYEFKDETSPQKDTPTTSAANPSELIEKKPQYPDNEDLLE